MIMLRQKLSGTAQFCEVRLRVFQGTLNFPGHGSILPRMVWFGLVLRARRCTFAWHGVDIATYDMQVLSSLMEVLRYVSGILVCKWLSSRDKVPLAMTIQ